nr:MULTISPECIES: 4-alpha-glucanotransferase [unclassified Prochlorococcus]
MENPKPRFTGLLLHITSLPTDDVCGTFGEASRKWIKLLSSNNVSVWQFLPLAPTDSTGSPYSSPSSFALNPWFLDAHDLAKEGFITKETVNELPNGFFDKNIEKVDFKIADQRSYYLGKALRMNWNNQDHSRHVEFDCWSSSQIWLDDHACFMELRRQYKGLPWWKWPEKYSSHDISKLNDWKKNYKDNLLEHCLLQWHLSLQLDLLKEIAKENGVLLFGDMPFYVSRDSADVWANRELFSVFTGGNLYSQSGVPPDYFSDTGQLWGTPVYRWEKHRNEDFKWWRRRFKRSWSQLDLLRLDHFRALDSFWSVPGHEETAQNGCWLPSPGLELLAYLKNDYGGSLPLIAEDLGVITESVDSLRNYFGFPGMKILQFAFDGNENNPYLPENIKGYKWIVYTGTHDNSTTNGWWNYINDDVKDMVSNRYKGLFSSPSWALIEIGMKTDSVLFISPVQDLLSLDDNARFNKPGTIDGNWEWKLSEIDENLSFAINKYGILSESCKRSFYNAHDILGNM